MNPETERAASGLFVCAGEPSGDQHAARVVRELARIAPDLAVRGFGGRQLASAGAEILVDVAARGVMGLFPVIRALPTIRRWFRRALSELEQRRPEALLLVDYPGFNLRLARHAKRMGIPVIYYIAPQVWAWNRRRVAAMASCVDLLLVILPFEPPYFSASGIDVRHVGHPVIDHVAEASVDEAWVEAQRAAAGSLVGLFPGSRMHVVASLWPVLSRTAAAIARAPGFESTRFVVAAASAEVQRWLERRRMPSAASVEIVTGRTADVMRAAEVCVTASGTTTLELAAHGTPFVIAYRVSPLLYLLGRAMITVDHIGLVNLVAGRRVVPEHVGVRSMHEGLARDVIRLLANEEARERMRTDLSLIREELAAPGSYARTAIAIRDFIAHLREQPRETQSTHR